MALRTREMTQAQFRKVKASGVFVAETEADHRNSMKLLQQNGFRALTYQKALVKIDKNPELKEVLKGKWFYLGGKGPQLSGYYTFNDKGGLTQGKGDIEKTVYVLKGSQPLSLGVREDGDAGYDERRFVLNAYYVPQGVARVVVGVRVGHEVAAPKGQATQPASANPFISDMVRKADESLLYLEREQMYVDSGMEKGITASKETFEPLRRLVDAAKNLVRE